MESTCQSPIASLPHGSPVNSMNPCSTKPMWRYTVRNDHFIVFVYQLIAVRLIHKWGSYLGQSKAGKRLTERQGEHKCNPHIWLLSSLLLMASLLSSPQWSTTVRLGTTVAIMSVWACSMAIAVAVTRDTGCWRTARPARVSRANVEEKS